MEGRTVCFNVLILLCLHFECATCPGVPSAFLIRKNFYFPITDRGGSLPTPKEPLPPPAASSSSSSLSLPPGARLSCSPPAPHLLPDLAPPPSPSSSTAAPAQESLEELDRRYAPYARLDAYEPMGLGPVGAAEAARLALAAAVLLPLRVMAGVLVVVAYYLVCRVCMLRVEEEREGDGGDGGGYARLEGWRQEVVVRCGPSLARAMMFLFGFYWIREYDCRLPNAEDPRLVFLVFLLIIAVAGGWRFPHSAIIGWVALGAAAVSHLCKIGATDHSIFDCISFGASILGTVNGLVWVAHPDMCIAQQYKISSFIVAILRGADCFLWYEDTIVNCWTRLEGTEASMSVELGRLLA